MEQAAASAELVAYCGLYCGECRAHKKGRCPGCRENSKAWWCKVRACCIEHSYASCAECEMHADLHECRKFHNLFSRLMGFAFNSDRHKCIARLGELGPEAYASEMAAAGLQKLPRR